jgi:hypothetical protein
MWGDQQTPVDRPLAELGLKRNAVLRGPYFVPAIFTVARSDLILTVPRRMGKIAAATATVRVVDHRNHIEQKLLLSSREFVTWFSQTVGYTQSFSSSEVREKREP